MCVNLFEEQCGVAPQDVEDGNTLQDRLRDCLGADPKVEPIEIEFIDDRGNILEVDNSDSMIRLNNTIKNCSA